MKPIHVEWVKNPETGDDKWELREVESNKIDSEKQGVVFLSIYMAKIRKV